MDVMDVDKVPLPGVAARYEFTTQQGDHVGIIAAHGGRVELVAFPEEDPDASRTLLRLTQEEAQTVATILSARRIAERMVDLTSRVPGLSGGQVRVGEDSPAVHRPVGEVGERGRGDASVVAIVRSDTVVTSPDPAEALLAGDVLVLFGTSEAIALVRELVQG